MDVYVRDIVTTLAAAEALPDASESPTLNPLDAGTVMRPDRTLSLFMRVRRANVEPAHHARNLSISTMPDEPLPSKRYRVKLGHSEVSVE